MKRPAEIVVSLVFTLVAGSALATPPGAGKHFDCSDGAATSCASDDTGCVPTTKDNLKCSDGLAKAFGKAIASVIKCHIKQADAAFKGAPVDDEACETSGGGKSAKEKLDAAIAKLAPLCTAGQLTTAAAEETTLFATKTNPLSLDAQNGSIYCAGSTDIDPGGDDAGKIPPDKNSSKCEDGVAKGISKMTGAVIKCHVKMADSFFKGSDYDENACEESGGGKAAVEKFNAAMTKLDAVCLQPCESHANRVALGANVLSQLEGANVLFYPCPVPCTCAGGTPSRLTFTTAVGTGTCGNLKNDSGTAFSSLNCGGLYFGGAGVGVPLPSIIPDMGASVTKVSSCANNSLTLSNTTSAETGSIRNCTSVGCLFGPPLPIPNSAHNGAATSTCVINIVSSNASGSADCSAGSTSGLALPLTSALYLTADLLPNRCSGGPTPGKGCTVNGDCGTGGTCVNDTGRCTNTGAQCTSDGDCGAGTCETGVCAGGTNSGKGCITSADCPSSTCTTFIQPCPICNASTLKCNGGPNDGMTCTLGDSAVNGDYPTSHDCPPPAAQFLGNLPIGFNLDSGTTTKTAVDYASQVNVFCGFCKNKVLNTFKNPFVTCTSDADCASVSGFTNCGQRTSGAFTANDVARTITATGAAAGALTTGGAAKPAKLVSIFCIPPTFNSLVDSAADLPGPGMTALQGTTQLLP